LHPKQFAVNEVWLAFKATRSPVQVDDSPHDIYIVQDAASMYLFGNAFAPAEAESPTAGDAALVLTQAWQKKREWPTRLLVAGVASKSNGLAVAADLNKLPVEFVPESELAVYIEDVRSSYDEFIARDAANDA
jgi:hypothetical protein